MAKKEYQTPKVESYGSIRTLTRAIDPNGIEDFDARNPQQVTDGSFDVVPSEGNR